MESKEPVKLNTFGCIVPECKDKREGLSGFCKTHKKEHKKIDFKIQLTTD